MEEMKMGSTVWEGLFFGLAIGMGSGIGLGAGSVQGFSKAYIPQTEQVQAGYIAPNRLEIECKDLDGNGQPETIMKIGDKPYLLREVSVWLPPNPIRPNLNPKCSNSLNAASQSFITDCLRKQLYLYLQTNIKVIQLFLVSFFIRITTKVL